MSTSSTRCVTNLTKSTVSLAWTFCNDCLSGEYRAAGSLVREELHMHRTARSNYATASQISRIIAVAVIRICTVTLVAAYSISAQTYKTDIPPAITIPDTVETRIGTLHFKDGFPDDDTVQKVYDNLDFQRGVQAMLTAMPAASLHAMRKASRSFGPDNQTVDIFENLADSRSLFLTANTESVYANIWLDLKNGPVVVEFARQRHSATGSSSGAFSSTAMQSRRLTASSSTSGSIRLRRLRTPCDQLHQRLR
jgi:hypothetical protein